MAPNQCQSLGAAGSGVLSLAPNPRLARRSPKRGWWDQGWVRGNAAAWDTRAFRMSLPAARQSWAMKDGSGTGKFTLNPASWDIIGTSGDGQVPVVTAGMQPAWQKPSCHLRTVPHHHQGAVQPWPHRQGGPTPKPAWPQAVGAHTGAARTPYSQPSRTKPVTKARIKAPK